MYYELKPFKIGLRLIEQCGSTENNLGENIRWSENSQITAYDVMTGKLKHLFSTVHPDQKDETVEIAKIIAGMANRQSSKFRTVIGKSGNELVEMHNSMPIEEYLEAIAANYD